MQHLQFTEREDRPGLTVRRRDGGFDIALDGRALDVDVLAAAPGEVDFRLDGRRRRAWVARNRDSFHVFLDGRVITLRLGGDEASGGGDDSGPGGPRVLAPMPGKVAAVMVEAGAEVERGDTLLLLEAMKMETGVGAPVSGRVSAVHAVAGQTVAMGELLVEIEPRAE